jgi:HEAT repeat protein
MVCAGADGASAQHEIDPETWVQMRKMVVREGPEPSVAEDIAALENFRGAARHAGPRLIERGPEILPELHAALLVPDAPAPQLIQLLQVLGGIGDARSVEPVVRFAEQYPERRMLKDVFLVLAMLPQTEASDAFAVRVAENADETWYVRRMIFTYFGMHRDPRGLEWAEALLDHRDPERRAAALFLLARLGQDRARDPIAQMLKEGAPPNARGALLLALAELVGPSEFEALAPTALSWSDEYRDSLRYTKYRTTSGAERATVCREMLRAELPGHMGLAVRCLLEQGLAHELHPYVALDLEVPGRPALLKSELRRAGYRVIDTEDEFRIEPARTPPGRSGTSPPASELPHP